MKVTVNNITNPAVAVDCGFFGLLQPGASKTLSIQAAVFESVAGQIVTLASKGYVTFSTANDPGTPTGAEVLPAALVGQIVSPFAQMATGAMATGATIGPAQFAWSTATQAWPTTGFYASGATPTGAYATGAYPNLLYLSSGAVNGFTAGLSFQNGPIKSTLQIQFATNAGGFSVNTDGSAIPTTQVAFGAIPSGGAVVDILVQPSANFLINVVGTAKVVSATLYEVNS